MFNKKKLDEVMAAVGKLLPGTWIIDPKQHDSTWATVLIDEEGRGLFCSIATKDKIEISGNWPRNYLPTERRTIKVSAGRDTQALAKDIQRRFLPWYLETYAEQMTVKAATEKHVVDTQALSDELSAMVNGTPWGSDGVAFGKDHHKIKVHSPTSVHIDLRLDDKQARQVLKALKNIL